MRILTVAGFALAGCTSTVGSNGDAAPSGDGTSGLDDALVDATPVPLPAEPSGFQIAPDGLLANAAVDAAGTLFVVGTRRTMVPSLNDAVIYAAQTPTTTSATVTPFNACVN